MGNIALMISSPYGTVHAEKELCVPRLLAILLVFYIVKGLKRDLVICFNVLRLPCKDHVNIHATSN